MNLKEIGNRISERRKLLGYTQEQIAEKIDVSVQMVSNLERGNKAVKIDNLIKISDVLDVSADFILTGKRTERDISDIAEKLMSLSDSDINMIEMLIDYCLNNDR